MPLIPNRNTPTKKDIEVLRNEEYADKNYLLSNGEFTETDRCHNFKPSVDRKGANRRYYRRLGQSESRPHSTKQEDDKVILQNLEKECNAGKYFLKITGGNSLTFKKIT